MLKATAEISLYPLNQDYIPAIDDFIARLKAHPGFTVKVNATSTQVSGEYDALFNAIQQEIKGTFLQEGKYVFAVKFLKGDLLT